MSPSPGSAVPKIDAPTVAEHRANQERALLDAARELLLADGRAAVRPAAVGAAAGLARSSVYKYFGSGEEILARIAVEAFADWGARVREAVLGAADADERIDAYVRTTLELAESGAHRVAVLGGGVPSDDGARERLAQAHRDLAAPLVAALAERGEADPALTAELIDGALGRAIDQLDAGRPARDVAAATLEFVRRAVGIQSGSDRPTAWSSTKENPCSW
jgi:AcrR family transcriptional regulator